MSDDQSSRSLVGKPTGNVPSSISLSPTTSLDLSWMPEDQRRALLADHTKGALDIYRRAQELGVDVTTLRSTLDTLADTTQKVSQAGDAVTITHVQTSQFGRTEVIMGNTDTAAKGKLSRTQSGDFNWVPIYVIGGVIAAIVMISIVLHH